MLERGLVIKEPWIGLILSGEKMWEIRGSNTGIRGRIELIRSGSGLIVGEADLVDSRPVTKEELERTFEYHRIPIDAVQRIRYTRPHAWTLSNVVQYFEPVPYRHPQGAVVWVDLQRNRSQSPQT